MNKLFTKIATAFVGMAMAIGVGVAVANLNGGATRVDAAQGDTIYSFTLSSQEVYGNPSVSTRTEGRIATTYFDNQTYTSSSVTWTFSSASIQKNSDVYNFQLGTSSNGTKIKYGVLAGGQQNNPNYNNTTWNTLISALETADSIYSDGKATAHAYAFFAPVNFSTVGEITINFDGGTASTKWLTYIFGDSGSGYQCLKSDSYTSTTATTTGSISYTTSVNGGVNLSKLAFVARPAGSNNAIITSNKYIKIRNIVVKEGAQASSTYSVTYNKNCSEDLVSGSVPTDATVYSSTNNTVTVKGNENSMSRGEKYEFAGWALNEEGTGTIYGPGDGQTHTYTISSTTTFFAKWNQVKYTVSYDGNGNTSGNAPAAPTNYNAGSNVTVLGNTGASVNPAAPFEKTGNEFAGWNTANDGTGTKYNAGDTISSIGQDLVLYAMWEETDDEITGTTWTYTVGSKTFDPINSTKKLAGTCGETPTGLKWTLTALKTGGGNVTYSGYDSTKGQQVGSGSADAKAETMSLSTSSFASLAKITSVTVNTSGGSSVSASVSVRVGNVDFKRNTDTSVVITATATNYTFTGNGSGNISINWSQSSNKALYFKAITVVYEIESSVVATEVSVTGSANVDGQDNTSVQSTYSYDVTYEAGKTGDKANVEVSVTPSAYAEVGTISNQQFTVTFKKAATFKITVSSTETIGITGTIDVTVTNILLTGYSKLTSEVNLYPGAKILIVDPTDAKAAGAITDKGKLTGNAVTIDEEHIEVNGKGDALEFTVGGTVGAWTLTSSEGLLGSEAVKTLVYDDADATTTWNITISQTVGSIGKAHIALNGEGLGQILYNDGSTTDYFANYSSDPTATNRLPEIYIKAAEDKVFNFIENNMRMGDTALIGNGTGACKNSGYYLNAKKALAALSETERGYFEDNEGNKYTAALARYIDWAKANSDANPFDGKTTISSSQRISLSSMNDNGVAIIVVIVSLVAITSIGGYFFIRKRKAQ